MLLFIEPVSKNLDLYVPAYPLPIMEIASFLKMQVPKTEVRVISMAVDYGLPITLEGKTKVYQELIDDIASLKPRAIGISCTAIAQAEETIQLCELIKAHDPGIFVFLGGYFPTLYYEEIFSRTRAVDLVVRGEGEIPALEIARSLERGESPFKENVPNLVWWDGHQIHATRKGSVFDLRRKALLNLELLRFPREYDVLPYAFSRGCPYHCSFCMEEHIRPKRREVPQEIIWEDLSQLTRQGRAHTLLMSDALFKSFDILPMLRPYGMKINFETRCDLMDPEIIPQIADICGILALGLESASYESLRRMNKIKERDHYERYLANALAVFKEAAKNEIPMVVFMIAGYPGDTEDDLKKSLSFAEILAKHGGIGGHVFKIGECRVYPKTKLHSMASAMPDTVFDDHGVFGENIVRKPSKDLDFETVLYYMKEIFNLSNHSAKIQEAVIGTMPFFRTPAMALMDSMIPDACFRDDERGVLSIQGDSLSTIRKLMPKLKKKYEQWVPAAREARELSV